MIIDEKSLLDLAVHLRHASNDLLTAAQRLSRLCDPGSPVGEDRSELLSTLDSLVSMNREFTQAERLLRAVWNANRPAPAGLN